MKKAGVHTDGHMGNIRDYFSRCTNVCEYLEGVSEARMAKYKFAATMCLYSLPAHLFANFLRDLDERGLLK